MEEFWQQATQILAGGEPAVLATVMAVHRQVPKSLAARNMSHRHGYWGRR